MVMLTLVGDEQEEIFEFPNGMIVRIDFSEKQYEAWGFKSRLTGTYRRIQLLNTDGEVLSEIIELNPHKTDIPKDSFNDGNPKDVIY